MSEREYDRIYVEILDKGVKEIKKFSDPFIAWDWIIQKQIRNYVVSKGLCVVDNS